MQVLIHHHMLYSISLMETNKLHSCLKHTIYVCLKPDLPLAVAALLHFQLFFHLPVSQQSKSILTQKYQLFGYRWKSPWVHFTTTIEVLWEKFINLFHENNQSYYIIILVKANNGLITESWLSIAYWDRKQLIPSTHIILFYCP